MGHLKKEQARISELIQSTIYLIRTEYRNIEITTDFESDLSFNCFPSKLNQVFMNLIINACQAIHAKTQTLKAVNADFNGKIIVNTQFIDNKLIIIISDNGCGMDEATQEKIFEPFFTTKNIKEGTGLGMSVSFDVIQSHNGNINVSSTLGQGTEVMIKLPI